MEVSEAARNYGRAMCLDPSREGLPLEDLTPDEQACVLRVGRAFERRVDEALGATPPEGAASLPVQTPGGRQVARLSLDGEGNVLLCLPDRSCAVVGRGIDAAVAAEQTLGLMGLTVAEA